VDIHNTVPPVQILGGRVPTRPPCPIGIDAPVNNYETMSKFAKFMHLAEKTVDAFFSNQNVFMFIIH